MTAVRILGFRAISRSSPEHFGAPRQLARRMTTLTPMIRSRRSVRLPIFEMPVSFCSPPVDFCKGAVRDCCWDPGCGSAYLKRAGCRAVAIWDHPGGSVEIEQASGDKLDVEGEMVVPGAHGGGAEVNFTGLYHRKD